MKVNSISKNNLSCNFKKFYLERKGALVLAEEFKKNPKLEKEFITNIVSPLENVNANVFYDGYTAKYHCEDRKGCVIDTPSYFTKSNLGIVGEYYSRNLYRSHSIGYTPTNHFSYYGGPLKDIEAAKNIACDLAAYNQEQATKSYKDVMEQKNETIQEIAQRLEEKYGIKE